MARASIIDRFMKFVEPEPNSGCWLWTGYTLKGHSRFGIGDHVYYGHRVAYELFVGPIPEGLELDHKCRVRCCVNPSHLEPVTAFENHRRGDAFGMARMREAGARILAERNACRRGHPFTEANTVRYKDGSRTCRQCVLENQRERRRLYGRPHG